MGVSYVSNDTIIPLSNNYKIHSCHKLSNFFTSHSAWLLLYSVAYVRFKLFWFIIICRSCRIQRSDNIFIFIRKGKLFPPAYKACFGFSMMSNSKSANLSHMIVLSMYFQKWFINPLSTNTTKWSNTLKLFVGNGGWIMWVCLTILWGWHWKG